MIGSTMTPRQFLDRVAQELARIEPAEIQQLSDLIWQRYEAGRFVFIIGNGGSGSNASHFCEDMGKGTLARKYFDDDTKKRLKVLSLTDNTGWLLAVGNDCGYDQVFVQQLMNYGSKGDLVVAISGSGNSPNILTAVDWANRHGLTTFGLTGYSGGKLKAMQQHGLHVDLADMGMVESIHLCVFHWVLNDVYARINRDGRYAAK